MGSQVPIGRRNILSDKVKFVLALGGVTLSVLLILVLQSLYAGVLRESASFVRSLPGNVWVTQQGVSGLTFSNSFLTEAHASTISSIDGVNAVHRLDGRLTNFDFKGGSVRTYVWALTPGSDLGPEEQRFLPQPGTIFIDRSLAKLDGVERGDELLYGETPFTVAEIGNVGNVMIAQFAFIHPDDYNRLLGVSGAANFFLVKADDGEISNVVEEIDQIDGVEALTTEQFVASFEEGLRSFLSLLRVLTAISFIVGLALLSLTIYSATIERSREYAVMKVLGASPARLYGIVLGQSAIITGLGFAIGVGFAYLFNFAAEDFVPEFTTFIRWQDVLLTFGIVSVMGIIAAFLPMNRVARVEPASIFRA
jgi:putative ABC transport system permease protein